jgi:hypothetical protein
VGITENGEFCEFHCYLRYHCADSRVWAHTRIILWSIKTLLDAADVDEGLRTATGTSKCTPPHLHSRTQSLSELDFWIQEVRVLTNLTSCATPLEVMKGCHTDSAFEINILWPFKRSLT